MKHLRLTCLILSMSSNVSPVLAEQIDVNPRARETLQNWKWPGEWAQFCNVDKEKTVFVYRAIGSRNQDYIATSTVVYFGKIGAPSKITNAWEVNGELHIAALYYTEQLTVLYNNVLVRQALKSWTESSLETYTANVNIPPGQLVFAPGGMRKGEVIERQAVRDGMTLDDYGGKVPSLVYTQCSDREVP